MLTYFGYFWKTQALKLACSTVSQSPLSMILCHIAVTEVRGCKLVKMETSE